MKKQFKSLVILFIPLLLLTSCESVEYKGEYPELYSVATNCLLGNVGCPSHGDSKIEILEKDSFDRVLFTYTEEKDTYSLLICQKYDYEYTYYYDDYSFINTIYNSSGNSFSDIQILELKEKNDWNAEINETKLTKKRIEREKSKPKQTFTESQFEDCFKRIAITNGYKGSDSIYRYSEYLTSDTYGKSLYYAYGVGLDTDGIGATPDSKKTVFDLVFIFNSDGTYNEDTFVIRINDFYNYQDQLKEFKAINHWNVSLQ